MIARLLAAERFTSLDEVAGTELRENDETEARRGQSLERAVLVICGEGRESA